jgi:hypothetical protein
MRKRAGGVAVVAATLTVVAMVIASRACGHPSARLTRNATRSSSNRAHAGRQEHGGGGEARLPGDDGTGAAGDANSDPFGSVEQAARAILAASRAAYSTCETYEDDGTLDVVFRGDHGFSERTEFHTAFTPGGVRFAYRESSDEDGDVGEFSQFVADEAGITSYRTDDPATREESLKDVVAAHTGVSHGLAGAVLDLLPAGLHGDGVLDIEAPRLVARETLDGTLCDVIEGLEPDYGDVGSAERIRVWIAESDLLVRRVTEDWVETDESAERMRRLHPIHVNEDDLVSYWREAGMPDADIELRLADLHRRLAAPARGISTFTTTTYRPRCNTPVDAAALLATDGTL